MNKLIIFSAPSGSGKTTIVRELLKCKDLNLSFSISTTSREPRGQEQNGIDYYFISVEAFKKQIENQEFLEWEEVYTKTFYGTSKKEIERLWQLRKNILLDIDVFGGINVKKQFGTKALSLFIQPPSIDILRQRLENRQTDSAEKIAIRLAKAQKEMEQAIHFDQIIVNDNLATAVAQTEKIIRNFLEK
ncbi:guanylate kinase [Capnocytophaga catalasegens]|nr:guanylate kinase [Capnocytophaga catalasegens]